MLPPKASAGGAVEDLAGEILGEAGLDAAASPAGRREVLEALLTWIRHQVRYVAVEVGVGGYRPSAPAEVIERRWGDCKDKSLLLIELLAARGIEARPALVRSDLERPGGDFPSPGDFDHLIVAVSTDGLAVEATDDPVADGFLFVDPTQTLGGARHLQRLVQGQKALVVLPNGGSRRVELPVRAATARRRLDVELDLADAGEPRGDLVFEWIGDPASGWIDEARGDRADRLDQELRGTLVAAFAGVEVESLRWEADPAAEQPVFRVSAAIRIRDRTLVRSTSRGLSLRLPALSLFPDVSDVDALEGRPARLLPGIAFSTVRLHLPPGVESPEAEEEILENGVGRYSRRVWTEDGVVHVERQARHDRRWLDGQEIGELRELALAEHRDGKRRLRLRRGPAEDP